MLDLAWTIMGIGIVIAVLGFYFALTTTKTKSNISFFTGVIGLLIIVGGLIGGSIEVSIITEQQIEVEKKVISQLNCHDLKELILNNNKTQEAIQYATSTYLVNCT